MKRILGSTLMMLTTLLPWLPAGDDVDAQAKPAATVSDLPSLKLSDSSGRIHDLDGLRQGRVVLEWLNPSCPQSLRHHVTGTMKKLEAKHRANGVRWFGVYSGTQLSREAVDEFRRQRRISYPILLDSTGVLARQCGARRTPHMFVFVDGRKVYAGAIDNDSRDQRTRRTNYVESALGALECGDAVSMKYRRSYGSRVNVPQR